MDSLVGLSALVKIVPILLALYLLSYAVYQRCFHPLAKFPGPFLASLTNFWKFYHHANIQLPQTVQSLHEQYGPIVRIGPNDLNFNGAEVINAIYKAGRRMPKSQFYDAFTAIKPNIFGSRDEAFHALRRRQVAHTFSVASLKSMEVIFDEHINNLVSKVDGHAISGAVLDLKEALSFYGYDFTGHISFNKQFNTQQLSDPNALPQLNGHLLLGNLYGTVANLLPYIRTVTAWHPAIKRLIKSRVELATEAQQHVSDALQNHKENEQVRTLLTSLIDAKDPETGAKLDLVEINAEAFAFLVAGSHTTGGSLTILFHHLLHNTGTLATTVEEIDAHLPPQVEIYPFAGLEAKLPYTLACIRESFRVSPIAAMLLPREVIEYEGATIDGEHIPKGTNCSMINTCVHHNPAIWGDDHDDFVPDRFLPSSRRYNPAYANYLMHFGQGPRQCIGRHIALMSIWKILVTLLKRYEFQIVDKEDKLELLNYGTSEKKGPLLVTVKRR